MWLQLVRDTGSDEYINLKEGADREGGGPRDSQFIFVARCYESPSSDQAVSAFVFLQMFTLPQKDSGTPTTSPGSVSTQGLHSNHGDGLEGECSRKPDQKPLKLYGVGDPTAMFSSDSPYLSSRGSVIKWFWDSAEEGYRTYHRDEYDEDKNPSVSEGPLPTGTQESTGGGRVPHLDQQGSTQLTIVMLELCPSDSQRGV